MIRPRRSRFSFQFVVAALLVGACLSALGCEKRGSISLSDEDSEVHQAVVYGEDNREDYFASSNEVLRTLTRESIVALMNPWSINDAVPENVSFNAPTLGQSYGLCSSERFTEQPSASFCSGTLIDDDLVLTAGHCVNPGDTNCAADVRFVFNYFLQSTNTLAPVTTDDVYSCQEVVAFALGVSGGRDLDFAIVKLDRPVGAGRAPASISPLADNVAPSMPVSIIGMGSGIPAKLDDGGRILTTSSGLDLFDATTDSFGGNSGSGVFNPNGEVLGILVRGQRDYVNQNGCRVVNSFPDSGAGGGESVTYVQRAIDQLCANGWPSQRLCDVAASCGDGKCTGTETPESCVDDCAAICGNNRCEQGESETCPEDCGTGVAADWTCDASFFGGRDGCDCDCGAYDPDCDVAEQQVYNCENGEVCDANGACAAGEAPASWTCDPAYYGTSDGCDCACGSVDPDCADSTQSVFNCPSGAICDALGACDDSGSWTCEPASYDAGDGCDCGCGILDPDCQMEGQTVRGCEAGVACGADGACAAEREVPAEWYCSASYFAAGDGCDCDCGAYDPDCDDDGMLVFGCDSDVCLADGTCEEQTCSHVSIRSSRGSSEPLFAVLFLVSLGLLAFRRQKKRGALVGKVAVTSGLFGVLFQLACATEPASAPTDAPISQAKGGQDVGAEPKSASDAGEHVQQDTAGKSISPTLDSNASSNDGIEPRSDTSKSVDGAPCDVAEECAGGVCEGQGCGKMQGICASLERVCTKDHRAYCGCDGRTFYGSGTCPAARFMARRPCEAM